MQYLIGVDIGTQSTRAAVMEESGRILTQASKETELIYEGDRWVWQEPDRMYGDAVETVKAAVEKARIAPQQVASICMDAQMAGTMGIGKKGAIAGAGCGRKQDAQNCPSLGSGGRLDERNRRGLRPAGRNPGSVRLRRYRRLRCGRWDHEARGYV